MKHVQVIAGQLFTVQVTDHIKICLHVMVSHFSVLSSTNSLLVWLFVPQVNV